MWKLIAFVLPLAADSFAVSALLGASGASSSQRWRIAGLFAAFEGGMPLVGLALGGPLASAIGDNADYLAGAALIILGAWMLFADDHDEDVVKRLAATRGMAMIGLGLSISLDELSIGFTIGLARQPVVPFVIAIAVQAFLVAQLGLALGARVGERLRESAELLAAVALIGLGIYFIVAQLLRN